MSFEDDLQQQFDSARSALPMEPGSAATIRKRAAGRDRRDRVIGAAAVVAVIAAIAGTLITLAPDSEQSVQADIATETGVTDSTTEADTVTTTEADTNSTTEAVTDGTTTQQQDTGPITGDDFNYLGAFRLPAGDFGPSRFAFGGGAAAFNPAGDPGSADGYDGSMFMSGHPTFNPGVAEVSIPVPSLHDGTTDGLPIAEVLQPFADITDGRGTTYVGGEAVGGSEADDGSGGFRFGGLEVVDGATGPRLHWAIWQYGNVADNIVPGNGHSSLDLADPDPQGPWFLGDVSSQSTGGYVFTVPNDFAVGELGGRNLIAGQQDGTTAQPDGIGPPFFAYSPPPTGEPGDSLDTLTLTRYDAEGRALAGFGQADTATGAAWVETSDRAAAIVTVGRGGLGPVRYGEPGPDDCGIYSGQHAGPYEPLIMFYQPDDLAKVAAGELQPWEPEPYLTWNPAQYLIPTCDWWLSSIMFDAATNRVYIVQTEADTAQNEFSPIPVVHVFAL